MTATSQISGARESSRTRFRTDIQGLRAIAVLLVLAYHAEILGFTGGFIGVDVFFVISGFLITQHLLAQLHEPARIRLSDFYARRIRRILPASFAVLVASVCAIVAFVPPVLRAENLMDAVWTALYVPNIAFAIEGTDYLAEPSPSVFQHYWSLGVEEQFYLFWPLLLLGLWAISRGSNRILLSGMVAIALVSVLTSIWLTQQAQPWAFFTLPTRAWELLLGGLVAAIGTKGLHRIPSRLRAWLSWGALAVIGVCALWYDSTTAFPGAAAIPPVLAASLLIYLGQRDVATVHPLLATAPLQFLGRISYSLYLVHWPLLVIPPMALLAPLDLGWRIALVAISVPIAWLVTLTVEDPVRGSAAFSRARPRWSIVLALILSMSTVVGVLGLINYTSTVPLHSDRTVERPPVDTPVKPSPEFTTFVPRNLTPDLRSVSNDIPRIYGDGCHLSVGQEFVQDCVYGDVGSGTVIVLFGDSHAAQWFPALEKAATANGVRLETYTKSSCPSVNIPILVRGVYYEDCDRW